MTSTVRVTGLRELLRVTDAMPKEIKKGVRDELRKVAVPIRDEATMRFRADISADPRKSRYGISVRKTGSVSIEQRVKSKGNSRARKRPKFAAKQIDEILVPAANGREASVMEAMDNVLGILQRKWVSGK